MPLWAKALSQKAYIKLIAATSFCALISLSALLVSLPRFYRLNPFMETVSRDAESFGYFGDAVATFDDLANGFFLKFWRVSLIGHALPPMAIK